jgi:hypothetical protein
MWLPRADIRRVATPITGVAELRMSTTAEDDLLLNEY